MPTSSSRGSPDEVTAKFVLDVDPDNIVKAVFGGGKSELACSFGLEIPRPALDDTHNEGIRHALDAGRHLFSGDALKAAICSPTVAERPGMVRLRRGPTVPRSRVAACSRKPTAERGVACQWRTSSDTGSTASLPASGSRRMLEKKPDAALFGRPGRIQMVGRRIPIPSMKPRRE